MEGISKTKFQSEEIFQGTQFITIPIYTDKIIKIMMLVRKSEEEEEEDAYSLETFSVLQCIILQNVTTFPPIISSLTYQIHLEGPCTCARFIHDLSRSETIPSTPIYHPTKFNVITSNRLAVLCLQFHFGGLCTYAQP